MQKIFKRAATLVLAALVFVLFSFGAFANDYLSFNSQSGTVTACSTDAEGRLIIPQTINGAEVKTIGYSAFADCTKLTGITLPNTLTGIGGLAFSGCTALEEITIPGRVSKIDKYVFQNCSSLNVATLENGVEHIDDGTFWGCSSLKNVSLPETLTEIGVGAFYRSGIEEITLPVSLQTLGAAAFDSCEALKTVNFGGSVKVIGEWTFYGCTALESIAFPYGTKRIESLAFENCTSLKEVTVPESVTYISADAFLGCSDFVIIGCAGSAAESFAEQNDIPFRAELPHTHTFSDWKITVVEPQTAVKHECTVCGAVEQSTINNADIILGDANCDGTVDIFDSVVIAKYSARIAELSAKSAAAGNINGDSALDVLDAVLIARRTAGLA